MPPERNVFEVDQQQKDIAEAKRRERAKELGDLRKVLSTPEGRRFIWRMLGVCGIFRNPFTPNANQTGYNSGRMSIGQEILNDMNMADTTMFARMQQEYMSALLSKKEVQDA